MSKGLSPVQKNVIAEIVKHGKVEPACKQAGIAKSTYYEWLKIPEFAHELKKQQNEVYENSISGMKYLFTKALEIQEQLLNSSDERIRLRVSNAVINNTLKVLEANTLKDRLKTIEKGVEEIEVLAGLDKKFSDKNSSIPFDLNKRGKHDHSF